MADEQTMPPMKGVIPHLTIMGGRAKEAVEFYKRAFQVDGEPMTMPAEDGKRLMHAHLKVNGGDLMLADDFPEYREQHTGQGSSEPGGATFHQDVSDVDAAHKRAVDAGGKDIMPPTDMFWGQRYGQILDPFGHRWSFGGPVKGDA
jgi:PhnB protein